MKRLSDCPVERLAECRGAGGEVEVLGYVAQEVESGRIYDIRPNYRPFTACYNEWTKGPTSNIKLVELVDRAHVTRLQADLVSANADKEAYAQNAIDLRKRVDVLTAEVERLKTVNNFPDAVACVFDNLKFAAANTRSKEWDEELEDLAEMVIEFAPEYKKQWKDICKLDADNRTLQSELTKARVWERFAGYLLDNYEGQEIYEERLQYWLSEMVSKEANQSAPVAKGGE